ncbi:MAG: hypothetical protein IKA64_00545 [Clostridia bacterium]|nr:hypothetical protein [Clostridia bacterium]
MNRRILSAVLSSVDKAPTSSTGLGIVTYTAEDGGSLRSVTVIGNTVASVSNPVYPTVATYTHAGDPVTLDDGTTGYRFNLRIHGANFLDADEFLRICRILRPDMIADEDEEFFYLNCPAATEPIDLVTNSYVALAKTQYTFRAGAIAEGRVIGGVFNFNLQMSHVESSRIYSYKASGATEGVNHIAVVGLPYDTPRALQYVYSNKIMPIIAFEKKSFGIFQGYNPTVLESVEKYRGISAELILSEPLRSFKGASETVADEYSLGTGKIVRYVREMQLDRRVYLYLMTYKETRIYYAVIKSEPAVASGPAAASCLKSVRNLDALVGTTYSCCVSSSGWHFYFTLSDDYTTADEAMDFITAHPITAFYKRATPVYEDAKRVAPVSYRGEVNVEAASVNRPYVKAEYIQP